MKRYILLIATAFAAINASAQSSDLDVRSQSTGILLNRDVMTLADLGIYSQSTFQFGTARSMALAGAMTSLGGDATSMQINPAGLGMARSGEFTFTPMLTTQSTSTKGASSYLDDKHTNLAISNLSTTFNLYQNSDTKLISLNFGIGYNCVSNLNYDYSFKSTGNDSSIARLFSRQLTSRGVEIGELVGDDNPDWSTMPTYLWSAALGYKNGLTFQTNGEIPDGWDEANPDEPINASESPIWQSTWISDDASVDQYFAVESEGSIGEYDIALGGNISNKLYFGFTFGIQTLYHRLDLIYSEDYNQPSFDNIYELSNTNYNQTIITNGSGVNLKVGFTYRPVEQMRIGVAYHSPTYYSLSRQYQISMASRSIYDKNGSDEELKYASADSPILEDYGSNSWKYRTPSRLLLGYSYMFDMRGLISIDYQRDWYGSMKMRSVPTGVDMASYSNMSDIYQSVNTIRMGGEYKLSPMFAVRGGYGYSSSMVRSNIDTSALLNTPTTDNVSFYSAGIGYAATSSVSFDLTYMCQTTNYTSYNLFYSEGTIDVNSTLNSLIPSAQSAQSNSFSTKIKQHNVALSMVIKL